MSLLGFKIDDSRVGAAIVTDVVGDSPGMRLGWVLARWRGWKFVIRETHLRLLLD